MKPLARLTTWVKVKRAMAAGLIVIYDAVDVSAIPRNAQVILAYIDGGYVTLATVRAQFPNARIITVTTNGLNRADLCDVESGDATPAVAAQGVRNGLYVNVYSDRSTKPSLDAALAGLAWNWYCAAPGTSANLQPGSVATQFAWPGFGSPGNYDISVADPTWLNGPTPAPPVPSSGLNFLEEMLAMATADPGFTVRYLYRFCLGREVDAPGFATYVTALSNGTMTANDVMAALQDSPEGQAVIAAQRADLHEMLKGSPDHQAALEAGQALVDAGRKPAGI